VVSNWRVRGVPISQCSAIESATSGAVTRRDLRPDDWHRIWPELVTAEHPAPTQQAA
jgi:DNA-binding transcriptional regulator YdaS (Cro superfamily)